MTPATDTEMRDLILGLDQKIDTTFEKLEGKIDAIATDVVEIKIAQARADERLNALEAGMSDIKTELKDVRGEIKDVRNEVKAQGEQFQTELKDICNEVKAQGEQFQTELKDVRNEVKGQDARLWGFVVALFLSLAGVLTKVLFFPSGQL